MTLKNILLTLLCCAFFLSHAGDYQQSMLREDLVWVGGGYHLQVNGDTIVDGVGYKKVYRLIDNGIYDPNLINRSIFASADTPAACLRQDANGIVYRLCDNDRFSTDWDCFDWLSFDEVYSVVVNSTDTHYEVVMYDFGQPNVYAFAPQLSPQGVVDIEGAERRVYTYSNYTGDEYDAFSKPWLMIEGFGMLNGGLEGCDMVCPGRSETRNLGKGILGTYYVRNGKGEVLVYDDRWFYDYDENDNVIFAGDPYDFDRDGNFDIADVNRMINIMLKRQDDDPNKTADLTFDSAVGIEDLNLVINRLVSGVKPVKYSDLLKPKTE